ncbi:MAG: serine hydrolase [Candidatus Aminicenantaceae bacterium]
MSRRSKPGNILFVTIVWIALSILNLGAIESVQSPYAEAIKAFEKFVIEKMEIENVQGLSIGFVKDGFVWTKGFGYADLENMSPAKPESSYRLASVTKTITAIAVLQLVEKGKISLDAEVQTYVPYFPKKKWPVTVRQLLGHLGGISHYKNYDAESHIKIHKNTKEAIAIFKDFKLVAEPGTRYSYSSYGYNLLGAVVEGASGQSYGKYIKEHIFDPLGMKDSRLDDPVDLIPYRVRGYRIINGEIKNSEYVDISSRFAGGGTRSTVIDLLKYAQGIFSGKLLDEETWRQMFTPMALRDQHYTGYGMGWTVRPAGSHFAVSHGGSQPETRTHILIFPKERFAAALASNREGLDLSPFYRRLIQLILEEDIQSTAYAPDRIKQTIYNACAQTFFYGMSYYDWHGNSLTSEKEELDQAFSFFNKYVNEKNLGSNFKEYKTKIDDGIHPISGRALTKVGSHMAHVLREIYGNDRLRSYRTKGPLAFFSDYITISKNESKYKKFRFHKKLNKLISGWEKAWKATYNDFVRRMFFTVNTNFNETGPILKDTFSGAELYPDFSVDIASVSLKLLEKNDVAKAFELLTLNQELYPNSPRPLSALAFANIWTGKMENARIHFIKAHSLDPYHPAVSVNQFFRYRSLLVRVKKLKEALSLLIIATELHPKEARLYVEIGEAYFRAKQKEKAIEYFKKALEIDPELERAKKRLEAFEKEKEKKEK